jgi:hypothetical protein
VSVSAYSGALLAIPDPQYPESFVKTFAEFRSSKFRPYDGEEEQLNPGLWGKRLAEYFVARLPEYGLVAGAPIAEDWGWYIPVTVDRANLALCCGHQNGEDDEFLCFTDPQKPVTRKLFRKVDVTAQLTRLVQAVDAILSADPDIRALSWRTP